MRSRFVLCAIAYGTSKADSTNFKPLLIILHQRQKPGFLRLLQPESPDYSLINPFFQVLLRMVQDVSLLKKGSRGNVEKSSQFFYLTSCEFTFSIQNI
jgi:hypothetical protein